MGEATGLSHFSQSRDGPVQTSSSYSATSGLKSLTGSPGHTVVSGSIGITSGGKILIFTDPDAGHPMLIPVTVKVIDSLTLIVGSAHSVQLIPVSGLHMISSKSGALSSTTFTGWSGHTVVSVSDKLTGGFITINKTLSTPIQALFFAKPIDFETIERAYAISLQHALKGADAIQVATAALFEDTINVEVVFVSNDRQALRAAQLEALKVEDPAAYIEDLEN